VAVTSKPGVLFRRARYIVQSEGFVPFIKRALLFLKRFFFYSQIYYIYEKTLNGSGVEFMPKTQNVTLKVIFRPSQLDELIAEGFDISPYPDDKNGLKKMLNKGAILFCVFVHQELAHANFALISNEAKRIWYPSSFVVDYQGGEVSTGGAFTVPKYRGAGFYTYVCSQIYQLLTEKGFSKVVFTTSKDNIAAQKAHTKLGTRLCGEGRLLEILLWKSWKEKRNRR